MLWWITAPIDRWARRWGGAGALENARIELETRRLALQQVDAVTRRMASTIPVEESTRRSA